ncbi:ubiquitin-like modifier-activating enzyme 1, partial [Allomyces macrogynus ATCC 38327]
GLFRTTAENVNAFLDDKDQFVETALKTTANAKETLVSVETALTADRPASFNDCLVWARHRFELQFVQPVLQLLHNFPVDAVTSTGQPFWSGPKRAPKPLTFDAADPLHMEYIVPPPTCMRSTTASTRPDPDATAGKRSSACPAPELRIGYEYEREAEHIIDIERYYVMS